MKKDYDTFLCNMVLDNSEHTITNSLYNVVYSFYVNLLKKGLPLSGEF